MIVRGLPYCRGAVKRTLDLVLTLPAILLLSPLFTVLALGVLITMGPPVLFVQERAGREGRPFRLLKFRSMRPASGKVLPITGRGDGRVTQFGRLLRATKLDELPQLLNIVTGRMSIVGPRPEVMTYVAGYSPIQRRVLEVRPGLTDPASLEFRDEEHLLGSVPPGERETFYVGTILPRKLDLNLAYIDGACLTGDLDLIARTLAAILFRAGA
jgi:lipopolysaccharide/colanic/teichoic acid biosynthesis glycosyltransferase